MDIVINIAKYRQYEVRNYNIEKNDHYVCYYVTFAKMKL